MSASQGTESVGIVGLGYVGLPLAVAFTEAGCVVAGVEVDRGKVALLNSGDSYVEDVNVGRLQHSISRARQ